jgi:hypothetical protein
VVLGLTGAHASRRLPKRRLPKRRSP